MTSLMRYLLDPQFVVMVLAAVAAFATITSFVLPLLSGDRLDSRMKYVAGERERLRAESMARLAEGQYRGKLRTEPKTFMQRVVKQLNLRKALETDATRERLKMAGLRGQAPVVAFLFFRAMLPVATFGLTFFYLVFLNTYHLAPLMNLGLSIVGAYVGFYLPNIFISNLILRRQKSIKRVFPDSLDLLLICVQAGMSVESAMNKVASEIGSRSLELAEEFSLTTAELSYLPGAAPGLRKSWQAHGARGGAGGRHEPNPSRALRHGDRPGAQGASQGDPRNAHGGGREKGGGLGAQAHRANDPVLPAGAVHRDHGAGLHSGHGHPAARSPSDQTSYPAVASSFGIRVRRTVGRMTMASEFRDCPRGSGA